jgi:ankyrin repeat protein
LKKEETSLRTSPHILPAEPSLIFWKRSQAVDVGDAEVGSSEHRSAIRDAVAKYRATHPKKEVPALEVVNAMVRAGAVTESMSFNDSFDLCDAIAEEVIVAAATGDLQRVKEIIAIGNDRSKPYSFEASAATGFAVYGAASTGRVDDVRTILADQGAEQRMRWLSHALAVSVERSDLPAFRLLIGEKAEPEKRAFAKAIQGDCAEMLAQILKFVGFHPNMKVASGKDSWGNRLEQPALLHATAHGLKDTVTVLLEDPRTDVNNQRGGFMAETPLLKAIRGGHAEVVELLLADGRIDPNKDDSFYAPIHEAAKGGSLRIAQALLRLPDVDFNKLDDSGRPPIHLAIANKRGSVAKLIADQRKCRLNEMGRTGLTPLLAAISMHDIEVTKHLLKKAMVDPNMGDSELGMSPLGAAATRSKPDLAIIEALLARDDLNPNIQRSDGMTPLHSAVVKGNAGVVEMLLRDARVDPGIPNKNGLTPMESAVKLGRKNVIALLKDDLRTDAPR